MCSVQDITLKKWHFRLGCAADCRDKLLLRVVVLLHDFLKTAIKVWKEMQLQIFMSGA